jgi:hypothetical protein
MTYVGTCAAQITKEDTEPMRGLVNLGSLLLDKNPLHCCDIDETLPEGIVKGLRAACPDKACTEALQEDADKDEAKADKDEAKADKDEL